MTDSIIIAPTIIDLVGVGAALAAGLLGSGHCLAMCGPIAALPSLPGGAKPLRRTLFYNSGRLLSYTTIGAVFGALGYALGSAAQIAQWSLILRVGLGLMLVLIGLQIATPRMRNPLDKLGARFWQRLAPVARRLRPAEKTHHLFLLGLLWGWLPCGLVYSMLGLAAVAGNGWAGGATLLAFGIGTLPAMIGIGLASRGLDFLRQPRMRRAIAVAMVLSGLWLAAMPMTHWLQMPGGNHQHTLLDNQPVQRSYCHTIAIAQYPSRPADIGQ